MRLKYPIKILLQVSRTKKSTYYYTIKKENKDTKNSDLMRRISDIFYSHKERYGYRRITLELVNKGLIVNHKKVKRLMKLMRLFGVTSKPKAKYISYKGDMNGTVKNILLNKVIEKENHKTYYKRDFTTTKCNQKWATDVSEFRIEKGKLYLSPILDMHNGEIISYDISTSPNFKQTLNMLKKGI